VLKLAFQHERGSGTPSALKTATINGVTALTNAQGFTAI
jgi:hypothetical protein